MKFRFIVAALALALPVIVLAQVATTSTSSGTSTSDDSTVVSTTTATSTPDTSNASSTNITSDTTVGTSTSDVSATSSIDTDSVTSATTSTPIIASSTPSSVTSSVPSAPQEESMVLASSSGIDVQGIENSEQAYHQQTGHYLQVIPGDQLPSYESGTVSADLGADIPDTVRVDVYQAPEGDGYQISYEENGVFYSTANGPEASSRTYTVQPPPPLETATSTASTTPAQ